MEEFITTPGRANVGGNIVGPELGELNGLEIFQTTNSSASYGTTREIDGESIIFVKINYQP